MMELENKADKNIVIVAHKFNIQPDDDLVEFLNQKSYHNILHIRHSFSDAQDRCSYYSWYKNGKIYKKDRTRDYKWFPEFLIYFKEFLFTLLWIRQSKIRWDYYIGMDGLCSFFGLLAKKMSTSIKKMICWNLDFVPLNRFSSKVKNYIYRKINVYAFKNVDEMWDHTQKMVEKKEKILGIKCSDYKFHRIVHLGVWLDRIGVYKYSECEKHTLVFLGHLLEKQGVQIVLSAIPRIVQRISDFKFKIIGTGQYEDKLKKIVCDLKINNHVFFLGKIEDNQEVEKEISKCSLGIAPYIKNLDTFTQFGGDPGKIKTYLACGLPVLVTDVPWNAKKIDKIECGSIIRENSEDIFQKIVRYLLDEKLNQKSRDNAREYAKSFDYENIFNKLVL